MQVLCFRVINVLPYFQFNYMQFMAQSRPPVITANHTFERGCIQELGSAEREGWNRATQVCTAGSLISYYEEKGAVLAFSTSFFVQLCPNICQGEGEG